MTITVNRTAIDARLIQDIYRGGGNRAEGCRRVLKFIREGIRKDKDGNSRIHPADVPFTALLKGMHVVDPMDDIGSSYRESLAEHAKSSELMRPEKMLAESNPGVNTNAFQIITGELINAQVIEGYEADEGFIGDALVRTMPGQRLRNQRITGMTALGGPDEVNEGHPYEETSFEEKYVTTLETKKGRILSINEELILFDQTGEVGNRARNLGFWLRQERERTIVRGAIDAGDDVFRPSGTAEALYDTNGSNRNYIGSGNTTSASFNTAVPLVDWTDIDELRQYRAIEILDDRIDGTKRPIAGLNGVGILLVPEALRGTAEQIQNATEVRGTAGTNVEQLSKTPASVARMMGQVMSSPFVDEDNSDDWYFGQFNKQFVWTEIWPIQTFTQDANSEAAFERDVVLRVKVRYYGGISATDTVFVTKVDGA